MRRRCARSRSIRPSSTATCQSARAEYNSLQIKLDKRFSNGLQFRTFYVRAQLYNNRAESGQRGGAGVQNPIDTQAGEWSFSGDDVPHSFVFSGIYELPFGKNSTGALAKFVKGWTTQRHSPLRQRASAAHHHEQRPGWPAVQHHQTSEPQHRCGWRCHIRRESSTRTETATSIGLPGAIQGRCSLATPCLVMERCAASETLLRMSASSKITQINERYRFKFDAQAGNVTNRVIFCDPGIGAANTNFSAGEFRPDWPAVQSATLGSVRSEVRVLTLIPEVDQRGAARQNERCPFFLPRE